MTWNQKLALGLTALMAAACLAAAVVVAAVPDEPLKRFDFVWLKVVLFLLCALLASLIGFQCFIHWHDIHPVRYTRHIGVYVMGTGATATAGPIAFLGLQQVEGLGLKATFQEVGIASAVVLWGTFTMLFLLIKHYTAHYHTLNK